MQETILSPLFVLNLNEHHPESEDAAAAVVVVADSCRILSEDWTSERE